MGPHETRGHAWLSVCVHAQHREASARGGGLCGRGPSGAPTAQRALRCGVQALHRAVVTGVHGSAHTQLPRSLLHGRAYACVEHVACPRLCGAGMYTTMRVHVQCAIAWRVIMLR